MNTHISVRPAEPADLDKLVPLFEAYRAFYQREPNERVAREFLRRRLENVDSVILVAEDGAAGRVVGFVQLYPVFSSLRMSRALILNDLYVAEEHRRGGVARTLMEAARSFAEISGATSLSLETAEDNAKARALYESLGWTIDRGFLRYTLETKPQPGR